MKMSDFYDKKFILVAAVRMSSVRARYFAESFLNLL